MGNGITLYFETKLPPRIRRNLHGGKGVKKYYGDAGTLLPVLFRLTQEQLEKLEKEVKKTHSDRANISRKAIDTYWLNQNKKKIVPQPLPSYQKHSVLGLKTVSVTLRKDQAEWLRSMAELTGKTISQLGRDALDEYLAERENQ